MKILLVFVFLIIFPVPPVVYSHDHNNQQKDENYLIHNTYGRFGKFTARPGKADELLTILLNAAGAVSKAQGCRMYIVSRDVNDGNIIWVFEVWDSPEDHQNSLQLESVIELISQALPLLDGRPEGGVTLEVIGGLGMK
jgi:quinol monooxygenase YgiN